MIRAVGLWSRRSSVFLALPALVGLVIASAWSRRGWQYEWDWALSWTASATVLLGPALAGLVAHDRARRHAPTLTLLERTASRGPLAALSMPSAAFLLAMAAWSLAAAGVLARVLLNDPVGRPTASIFVEVALVLLASAFVGGAVGSWMSNRAAGPVAALAVYATFILAPHLELGGLMEAGGSTATMVDLERQPQWLAGFVASHLSVVAAAALATLARGTTSRSTRTALLVAALATVMLGAVALTNGKEEGSYRTVASASVCLGTSPVVCGPSGARPVLTIAQDGLNRAYGELAESGLPLRQRYVMARGLGGEAFPPDAGDLSVDPSTFVDGAYSRDDLLMTLSTPTLCASYFDDSPPTELMDAQSAVITWVDQRLSGEVDGPAPASVQSAYRLILSCEAHEKARR